MVSLTSSSAHDIGHSWKTGYITVSVLIEIYIIVGEVFGSWNI